MIIDALATPEIHHKPVRLLRQQTEQQPPPAYGRMFVQRALHLDQSQVFLVIDPPEMQYRLSDAGFRRDGATPP